MTAFNIYLRDFNAHPKAQAFIDNKCKRKIAKAGRRGAKTVMTARIIADAFLAEKRIVYGAPVSDQLEACWFELIQAFREPIDAGVIKKDETEHSLEKRGTMQRIRLKTAYNADTWRGDKGDLLVFDEWQLMNEDAWHVVGAPMLMDNDGDAIFLYTPPKLIAPGRSQVMSKARDPGHAANMFKLAQAEMQAADKEGRAPFWYAAQWTSLDNPWISPTGLENAARDMTQLDYQREILVNEIDDNGMVFRDEWLRFYAYKPSDPSKDLADPTNFLLITYHVPAKEHENQEDEIQPEPIFAGSLDLRVILDPNHAGKNGRCKHAISVVGFDAPELRFHLLDEWAESCGYEEMGRKLFELCGPEKWNMREVWIEAVASQVYCKLYLEELNNRLPSSRRIKFNELPKDNRANAKDRRIESLEPFFKNHQFWIHKDKCKQFRAEYSSYYRGKMVDVDLLDTVAYAPQLYQAIGKRQVQSEVMRRQEMWEQREVSTTGYG